MKHKPHFGSSRFQLLTAVFVAGVAATAHADLDVPTSLIGPPGTFTTLCLGGTYRILPALLRFR